MEKRSPSSDGRGPAPAAIIARRARDTESRLPVLPSFSIANEFKLICDAEDGTDGLNGSQYRVRAGLLLRLVPVRCRRRLADVFPRIV